MLEIRDLTRRFGDVTALDGLTFDVAPARMTGFVGANGAGKTTTMRIVLGVLSATSGEVRWDGHPVTRADRQRFGYMPEERGLYPKQRVHEQLVYFGRLHGMAERDAARRVDDLLERLDLAARRDDRLDTLSLGNQQRVQIAAALVHRPIALVLDEPFSGLDPIAVDAMASLLRDEVADGVPVLFSSHQLDLVEQLCDDLVILAGGRVAAAGGVEDLRRSGGSLHRLVLADGADAGWVRDVPGVVVLDVDGDTALVDLSAPGAGSELLTRALARGEVHELAAVVPALSDVFREVVR
ncbi:ABC transporter ATP-binding protein [Thalassiella azotivora]